MIHFERKKGIVLHFIHDLFIPEVNFSWRRGCNETHVVTCDLYLTR